MQELSLTFVIHGEKETNPAVLVPIVHHFDKEIKKLQPKDDTKPKTDTFNLTDSNLALSRGTIKSSLFSLLDNGLFQQ